jgi:riboflavin-specific deaminase-like protein
MKRPFVLINMAMTADGKIATANRAVSTFGSARDHEHLLELRATADAVMAGARTVDAASVNLGPGGKKFCRRRLRNGLAEYNVRVIVSGSGTIDPQAEVFKHRFSPILILTTDRAPSVKLKHLRGMADEVRICGAREIDFAEALSWLRERWQVKRLVCEGGAELNDALFRIRMVDELHMTICPRIFGGRSAPTLAEGTGAGSLAQAADFRVKSLRRIGDELFAVFAP